MTITIITFVENQISAFASECARLFFTGFIEPEFKGFGEFKKEKSITVFIRSDSDDWKYRHYDASENSVNVILYYDVKDGLPVWKYYNSKGQLHNICMYDYIQTLFGEGYAFQIGNPDQSLYREMVDLLLKKIGYTLKKKITDEKTIYIGDVVKIVNLIDVPIVSADFSEISQIRFNDLFWNNENKLANYTQEVWYIINCELSQRFMEYGQKININDNNVAQFEDLLHKLDKKTFTSVFAGSFAGRPFYAEQYYDYCIEKHKPFTEKLLHFLIMYLPNKKMLEMLTKIIPRHFDCYPMLMEMLSNKMYLKTIFTYQNLKNPQVHTFIKNISESPYLQSFAGMINLLCCPHSMIKIFYKSGKIQTNVLTVIRNINPYFWQLLEVSNHSTFDILAEDFDKCLDIMSGMKITSSAFLIKYLIVSGKN